MMLHRIIIIIITRITYRYKHIHKCNLVKTRNYCHLHGCDQQLKKACNKNKTFCTIEETRAKLNGHKPCLKIMGKIKIQNFVPPTLHVYTYWSKIFIFSPIFRYIPLPFPLQFWNFMQSFMVSNSINIIIRRIIDHSDIC